MKNYQPRAEFQGSAQGGQYNTAQIASIVPHMEAEHRRQQQGFQRYIEGVAANNERMVRVAAMAGDDMKHLSKLSKTLGETFIELHEWQVKDKEINDAWEALMGGDIDAEILQQEKELDHDLANISAETRETVEKEGGLGTAQLYQYDTPGGYIAPSYASGLQALSFAQTSYAPFLQGWSTSNVRVRVPGFEGTVAQGYASGDPRVIAALTMLGRQSFLRGLNLNGATKADVVKYLSTTVPQAEGALNMAAVNKGAEQRREQHRQQILGQGYTAVQTMPHGSLQEQLTQLQDMLYMSGAAPDRATANNLAVQTLIAGLKDQGSVEGLRALLGIYKIPGQQGTQLAGQYGPDIQKAIFEAQRNRNNLERIEADQIERDMYAQLAKAPTAVARGEAVERAAQRFEDAGLYEKAREIREQQAELQVAGNSQVVAAELLAQVRQGVVTDPKTIDQYVARGQISPAQAKEIKNQLAGVYEYDKPTDKLGASLVKSTHDRVESSLEVALGIRRDVTGNIITIQGTALDAGTAQVVIDQAERDLNAVTNQWLRDNAGATEQQKLIGIQNLHNQWIRDNVETEGAKYYVPPVLRSGSDADAETKKEASINLGNRFRGLVQKPATFATPGANFGKFGDKDYSQPQQLTWTPGVGVSRVDAQQFNPLRGDTIFEPASVGYYAMGYNENGSFDPNLVMAADQLGMSPMSLLRQQISAHGLDIELNAPATVPSAGRVGTGEAPLTAVDGANLLMSMGVPAKGAAWLAGNINTESGWNPNRTPWDDVGAPAGGLVSWRAGRLTNAEQAFGPVEQASTQQQLDYMLKEMREKYPEQYRIFMNPYATDRQLMRASSAYWGYGTEGERFSTARQIERQLQRVPEQQRKETVELMNMPAKQRTVAVGKKIIEMFGLKPWQHPNFDADKGFVAEGGARNWERPYNSYHNHNQALDIPLHPYGGEKLDELYKYLNANRKQLGITELLWRCPNHMDHIHVAFG